MLEFLFSDQFIRYIFVGAFATTIDLTIFQTLITIGRYSNSYAFIISFLISVFFNFILCYHLVFPKAKLNFFKALAKHYIASSTGFALNFLLFQLWMTFIYQTPILAKIAASTLTFICNFLMFKWFSFYTHNKI